MKETDYSLRDSEAAKQFEYHIEQEISLLTSDLARELCSQSDQVTASCQIKGKTASVKVNVAPCDFRRMVGGGGRMHQAFKVITAALAAKHGFEGHYPRMSEPSSETKRVDSEFVEDRDWPKDRIFSLFSRACSAIFDQCTTAIEENGSKCIFKIWSIGGSGVPDYAVGDAMSIIFNAIGKNHGIFLTVEVQ